MRSIYKLNWSANAVVELNDTIDYLERNFTQKEVNNLFIEIERVSKLLIINPNLFALINTNLKVRRVVLLKFNNLYYTFDKSNIYILSFYSNRQKSKNF